QSRTAVSAGSVAALALPKEALDIRNEVISHRKTRLVGHLLEALHVRLGALIGLRRGVEQRARLERLHRQLAQRWPEAEVPADMAQQLDGRLRVRRGEVVRNLGEETHARNPALRQAELQHRQRSRWHPQPAVGPLR